MGWWFFTTKKDRIKYIDNYDFSGEFRNRLKDTLISKVKDPKKITQLLISRILIQLKHYFITALESDQKIGMPSWLVDEAWHLFILDTKEYSKFCKNGFGKYFHHEVSIAKSVFKQQDVNAWVSFCKKEKLDPKETLDLPPIYRLDIDGGVIKETYETYLAKLKTSYLNFLKEKEKAQREYNRLLNELNQSVNRSVGRSRINDGSSYQYIPSIDYSPSSSYDSGHSDSSFHGGGGDSAGGGASGSWGGCGGSSSSDSGSSGSSCGSSCGGGGGCGGGD